MDVTAIIERECNGYASLCSELDIASQGATIENARENLREALELFFECASPVELHQRLHGVLRSIVRQSCIPHSAFESP